jgi:hypothetical protein
MLRRAALALLLTAVSGCAGGGLRARQDLSTADTEAIFTAVYRYQIAQEARRDVGVFCLCAPADRREGADPAPGILQQLAKESHSVVACSACLVEDGRVSEKQTGRTALTCYINALRPLLSGDVEVEGGVRAGRFSSTRLRYRVVPQKSGWVVTDALGAQVP